MFLINFEKSARREGVGFFYFLQSPKNNTAPKEIPTIKCLEKFF